MRARSIGLKRVCAVLVSGANACQAVPRPGRGCVVAEADAKAGHEGDADDAMGLGTRVPSWGEAIDVWRAAPRAFVHR